jgi:hypothetical protein
VGVEGEIDLWNRRLLFVFLLYKWTLFYTEATTCRNRRWHILYDFVFSVTLGSVMKTNEHREKKV